MQLPKTIVQKINYCFTHQLQKQKEMGNYRYLSLLIFISQFTLLPSLLKVIWPYVEGSMPNIVIYAIIIFLVNVVTIGGYNAVMYWVYTSKIPFFEQFRADANLKWPWEQNKQKWSSFFVKSVTTTISNLLFGVAVIYLDTMIRYDILMTLETCPDIWTMVWQFFFFLYMEELIFYTFHRVMHHPKLYFLHKQHHEYNVTTSLAIIHSGKVEQFSNVVATGIAYKILAEYYPVHIFTVIIWLIFRFVESLDGHCGYEWPWAVSNWVPFTSGGKYHFFHHSNNVGNFGGIVHVFDTIFGTNKVYLQKKIKEEETKKKRT